MEITCEYLCGSANNVSKAVALVPEHNEIVYAICNLVVVMNATTQVPWVSFIPNRFLF